MCGQCNPRHIWLLLITIWMNRFGPNIWFLTLEFVTSGSFFFLLSCDVKWSQCRPTLRWLWKQYYLSYLDCLLIGQREFRCRSCRLQELWEIISVSTTLKNIAKTSAIFVLSFSLSISLSISLIQSKLGIREPCFYRIVRTLCEEWLFLPFCGMLVFWLVTSNWD